MTFLLAVFVAVAAPAFQGSGAAQTQTQTSGARAATPPRDATPESKKGTAVIKDVSSR
jgi:hypothetical protein